LAINSLSSALNAPEIARVLRDKSREVGSMQSKDEKHPAAQLSVIRPGGAEAFDKAKSFNQQTETLSHATSKEQQAITAYQSIAKEQQREDIQLLLGVDTFV
jgi:hypothetical protein